MAITMGKWCFNQHVYGLWFMVLITAWLRPGHPSLGGDYKPLTVYGGFLGQSTGCLNICINLLVTEHILIFF